MQIQTEEKPSLQELMRLGASAIGLAVMLTGLYLAIQMFGSIHGALKSPGAFAPLITQWSEALGSEEQLSIAWEGEQLPIARLLAIMTLGFGTCLLAGIALNMMTTGARIVSWTSSDSQAVKRIVRSALGK